MSVIYLSWLSATAAATLGSIPPGGTLCRESISPLTLSPPPYRSPAFLSKYMQMHKKPEVVCGDCYCTVKKCYLLCAGINRTLTDIKSLRHISEELYDDRGPPLQVVAILLKTFWA